MAQSGGGKKSGGKRKKKVESVFLVCKETGDYNYTIRRKPGGEKLKLKIRPEVDARWRNCARPSSAQPLSCFT